MRSVERGICPIAESIMEIFISPEWKSGSKQTKK